MYAQFYFLLAIKCAKAQRLQIHLTCGGKGTQNDFFQFHGVKNWRKDVFNLQARRSIQGRNAAKTQGRYFLKEFQMQVLLKMLIASQTQYMFQLLEEQVASLLILCTHPLILSNSVREDAKFIEGGGEAPEVVQDKYQ